jgi:Na+-translocating ferredoxin:NAD+ oxidoreductase RnfG subunit
VLDAIFWNIEKHGITLQIISSVNDVINSLYNDLNKVYAAEEILYKELKNVLPDQSSINAFKSENQSIINLLDSLKLILSDIDIKKQKDMIQAEMVVIADIVRRDVHKKTDIFLHEARTLLPEENLDELARKLNKHFAK